MTSVTIHTLYLLILGKGYNLLEIIELIGRECKDEDTNTWEQRFHRKSYI